jgi:hypothetical protein
METRDINWGEPGFKAVEIGCKKAAGAVRGPPPAGTFVPNRKP